MSIFSNLKGLFKRKTKLKTFAKGSYYDPEDTLQKPILRPEDDQSEVGNSKTTLRKLSSELSALEIAEQGAWVDKKARVWKKGDLILNTYKVEEIKEGGMGYVYIAEHQGWKVKMAIKSPNEKMLSDRSLFSRVLREANKWIDLGLHPHIAYCYYVRQIEDVPHIFIEYGDGGTLRDWISNVRCYNLKVGLNIAIQFCYGMDHAHSFGIIHRDIKPENILMTKEGNVKITDFGIASGTGFGAKDFVPDREGKNSEVINKAEENLTTIGTKIGTYEYMSPEQYEDAHNVDERADIYSFGVCLYEMLCGRKPYDPTSQIPASILAKLKKRHPYEPCSLRKEIPSELSPILKKCCQLERDKRYGSFNDLRKELIKIYYDLFNEDPPHARIEAIELKADGLNNQAVSYLDLGREKDAIKCWQEALKVDPQHLEANFNIGHFRWKKAEISGDDYVIKMRELENNNRANYYYWHCLSHLYLERGDFEAIEKIEKLGYKIEDEEFEDALVNKFRPIRRYISTFKRYKDCIQAASISQDGKYSILAINNTINLLDIKSGEEIKRFKGHKKLVCSVSFSPDGKYVLSASVDNTIRLWDIKSGKEVKRLKEEAYVNNILGGRNPICFSPDGQYILSASRYTIKLWDIKSGKEIKRFEGHNEDVLTLCFSQDGHYILSGSGGYSGRNDNTVRLWAVETGKEIRCFKGHIGHVKHVSFFHDSRYVVSTCGYPARSSYSYGIENLVRVWDIERGKELISLEMQFTQENIYRRYSFCFSPDGRFALSASDKEVILWDLESNGRVVCRFKSDLEPIHIVCFFPNGHYALSVGIHNTINLLEIDYPPGKNLKRIYPYPLLCKVKLSVKLNIEENKVNTLLKFAEDHIKKNSFITAYQLLRKGQYIPGYERNKKILNLITQCGIKSKGRRKSLKNVWSLNILRGHTYGVHFVCFSPDCCHALSGGGTGIRLWNIEKGIEIKRFECYKGPVKSFCFSHDSHYALLGDTNIMLWDIENGKEIAQFKGHTIYKNSVCFSPDSHKIFLINNEETISVWDIEIGKEIKRFKDQKAFPLYFSSDSHKLFMYHNHSIIVLDIASNNFIIKNIKRLLRTSTDYFFPEYFSYKDRHTHPYLSPNRHYAITPGLNNIILWDVENPMEIREFESQTGFVTSGSFSPDGRYFLSVSKIKGLTKTGFHRTVQLWDLESGKEVRRFGGDICNIFNDSDSVNFSPDGSYFLMSGYLDNTFRLWDIATGKEIKRFEGRSIYNTICFSSDGRYALSGSDDTTIRLWEFDWEWEF